MKILPDMRNAKPYIFIKAQEYSFIVLALEAGIRIILFAKDKEVADLQAIQQVAF
jgi:hypothetical protein